MEQDLSGIQFYTEARIGVKDYALMIDGGSSVNSTTERLVLDVINSCRDRGICLGDRRHPIKKFEKWRHRESLSGIAGDKPVELLGSVVINVKMLELGKPNTGPDVLFRFKICSGGTTDWVGWIIGARAIDCKEREGLGFIPMSECHAFTTLGIQMRRVERRGSERPDQCYAIRLSVFDSDDESVDDSQPGATSVKPSAGAELIKEIESLPAGTALIYEGDAVELVEGAGLWVPVVAAQKSIAADSETLVVLPADDAPVEVVPGIWGTGDEQGMVCVVGTDEFDTVLEPGTKVAELHVATLQTRVCEDCGFQDTDAWVSTSDDPKCNHCGCGVVRGPSKCRHCGASAESCAVLSYAGCQECRPERKLRKGKIRRGPASSLVAKSAISFVATCALACAIGGQQPGSTSVKPSAGASSVPLNASQNPVHHISGAKDGELKFGNLDVTLHPVFHIIEEPGAIRYLAECEVPTEEYNSARAADLSARHPHCSPGVLEHLEALEPFLDTSIVSGFSYGVGKAFVCVKEGSLLGHRVDREGSRHEEERSEAIVKFAPLKDVSQVRQFVGSTNWIRRYLLPCYATAVKILGEYMKPTAVFPDHGLGAGSTEGCKAVKVIKLLCKHAINLSTMDVASAIDGSRPLEQVADACGIAWGSTNVQMTADLSSFKVLMMQGKGFTPAQQAWPALILEAYAQLLGKRYQRKILGPMRSLNWTDHANLTKAQHSDSLEIDLKILRWISEIIADGSEIRSLAGRAARLGDGTSRNPVDREKLLEQRTKDLAGLIGQVRGFDLNEFLSDWEEAGRAIPWALGNDGWVSEKPEDVKEVNRRITSAALKIQEYYEALYLKDREDKYEYECEEFSESSPPNLAFTMAEQGVKPKLKVLYVPDYIGLEQRVVATQKIFLDLSQELPAYDIQIALSEGPFEDDDSIASHFDLKLLNKAKEEAFSNKVKVDLHTSVMKLARNASMHKPKLIVGKGQGALVALAYGHPGALEQVFATRNVQVAELPELAQAWGNVNMIVIQEPRMSRRSVGLKVLRTACPELFQPYPVESRRTITWKDTKIQHYVETKELLTAADVQVVANFQLIPFMVLMDLPATLMWEHQGKCPCGKRTYLFGLCPKCLKEDAALKVEANKAHNEAYLQEREELQKRKEEDPSFVPPPVTEEEMERIQEQMFDYREEEGSAGQLAERKAGSYRVSHEIGATSPLYEPLARPLKRTGKSTQYVEFLDDAIIRGIVQRGDKSFHGRIWVQDWKPDTELKLKARHSPGYGEETPFRISFVIEATGEVIPLQQCVDVRREQAHVVGKEFWIAEPSVLVNVWEPTPVSKQLDSWLCDHYKNISWTLAGGKQIDTCYEVRGSLKKFVSLVCTPLRSCRIKGRTAGTKKWDSELYELTRFPDQQEGADRIIIFGRPKSLERWIVVLSEAYPLSRKSFQALVHSCEYAAESQVWCVVWGKVPTGGRKVCTLFSDKWMIYDRYGQLSLAGKKADDASQTGSLRVDPVPVAAIEGPVPNTEYRVKGDPKTVDISDADLVLTPDAVNYYKTLYDKRKEITDELRAEVGECAFQLGESLRTTWIPVQRADRTLSSMFVKDAELQRGYRVADDGLLERHVQLPPPAGATWVPVVPDGQAHGGLSWKRWVFLQCHVGVLGAHRSAEKTLMLISRQVWWRTMKSDVARWCGKCLTCLRFRKVPQRQETIPTVPTNQDCWEVVMIDLEGPNHPADKSGCKYTMTYMCCLCQGVFLEPGARLIASEARRMFANCVMRSGTIPSMVRSDRGPELKNAVMAEYSALVGLSHRFNTPWRPMETGLVENKHKETQKIMGMLVKDIMQCFPNETGELLNVVEFIVYNTPGPHGYTPRDIDRRWSAATPLDKELQPFAVAQFEPVSELCKSLFRNYRQIKVRVLGWLKASREGRASNTNRFRKSKVVRAGDEVVLRDPRQRKAGGRTGYRQPYTEPALVEEVHGNKCTLKTRDGTTLENIHLEDCILVPENARNLEKEPLVFEEDDEGVLIDDIETRRSPGMMIEDSGKRVEAHAKALTSAKKRISPGKLSRLQTGNFLAYAKTGKQKVVCIGKVIAISSAEENVIVHCHRPVSDGQLRLQWMPVYIEGGIEVLGSGANAATETVEFKRIVFPVQMNDGVIGHSYARQLDHSGYRYENELVRDINDEPVERDQPDEQPSSTSVEPSTGAIRSYPLKSLDGMVMSTKVEEFITGGRSASVSYADQVSTHPVYFSAKSDLQKWLMNGYVDFAELFRGYGELTIRIREAGCTASEGFDKFAVTYDRCWQLDRKTDQSDCAWLLVYSLQPKVIHLGTPCTKMCQIGAQKIDEATEAQNAFTAAVMAHQQAMKLGVSVENPRGSTLRHQKVFTDMVGTLERPKPSWSFYRSEGCQFHLIYPGVDDFGCPIQKACVWISNFDLSMLELRCKKPAALFPSTHVHKHARGVMHVEGVGSKGVADYTARYTSELSAVYAKACKEFVQKTERRGASTISGQWTTPLKELADSSKAVRDGSIATPPRSHGTKLFLLMPDDRCIDLCAQEHRASPLQPCSTSVKPSAGAGLSGATEAKPKRLVDQFHKVMKPEDDDVKFDKNDMSRSAEAEARARKEDAEHDKNVATADHYWKKRAEEKDWDCIKADLSVYRYSGVEVQEDPRRSKEYREKVIEGLGFAKGQTRPGMTEHDMEACREVLRRKASAFWLEDTPRTALRYLLHDTIPTGPPCRTPPHRLKGEEAEWVDEQLQKEVQTGQLIRGNSEWASPPFATKSFAEHRKQRKRRVVVDYRRVNQRILRAVYFVRSADGVVQEVSGSMWMTLVDACKGFNQVANTRRAREVLAILARSGQYLPVCLTFGPTNGPEDFAFATDRIFSPGRGRKMRFCTNWQIYADDITVRSGRWINGVYYSDSEYTERVRAAAKAEGAGRPDLEQSFKSLGFDPTSLGVEKEGKAPRPKAKARPKTKSEQADDGIGAESAADRSPRAHTSALRRPTPTHWFCACLGLFGFVRVRFLRCFVLLQFLAYPVVGVVRTNNCSRLGSFSMADPPLTPPWPRDGSPGDDRPRNDRSNSAVDDPPLAAGAVTRSQRRGRGNIEDDFGDDDNSRILVVGGVPIRIGPRRAANHPFDDPQGRGTRFHDPMEDPSRRVRPNAYTDIRLHRGGDAGAGPPIQQYDPNRPRTAAEIAEFRESGMERIRLRQQRRGVPVTGHGYSAAAGERTEPTHLGDTQLRRQINILAGQVVDDVQLAVQRSFDDQRGNSGRSRSRVTSSSTGDRGQQPSATRVNPSAGASSNRSSSGSRQPGTGGGAPPIGSRYDSSTAAAKAKAMPTSVFREPSSNSRSLWSGYDRSRMQAPSRSPTASRPVRLPPASSSNRYDRPPRRDDGQPRNDRDRSKGSNKGRGKSTSVGSSRRTQPGSTSVRPLAGAIPELLEVSSISDLFPCPSSADQIPDEVRNKAKQRMFGPDTNHRPSYWAAHSRSANQALRSDHLEFLRGVIGKKVFNCTRLQCISFAMINILRHGKTGDYKEPARLETDGTMGIQTLLAYKLMYILDATEVDVWTACQEGIEKDRSKQRYFWRMRENADGTKELLGVGATQGHSRRAQRQINVEELLGAVLPADRVPEIAWHGTRRAYVDPILEQGLMPGGARGRASREHIHLVATLLGDQEQSGVRSGSDSVIKVRLQDAVRDGLQVYLSRNNVYLTSGFGNDGIPPRYIVGAFCYHNGSALTPIQVPKVSDTGRPEGAEREVMSVMLPEQEARRIMNHVVFTFEEEESDRLQAEEVRAAASAAREAAQPGSTSVKPSAGASTDFADDVQEFVQEPEDEQKIKTGFVNTVIGSGRFKPCKKNPLEEYMGQPLPEDHELYLVQLAGAPVFSLPWYTKPAYEGKEAYPGLTAGTKLGPVRELFYCPESRGRRGVGMLSAAIDNPFLEPGQEVDEKGCGKHYYVNVWTTHNKQGKRSGVLYAEPLWEEIPKAKIPPAVKLPDESTLFPPNSTFGLAAMRAVWGSEATVVPELDEALRRARATGWPKWITPGLGGYGPWRTSHDFLWNTLHEGARVDFYRGTWADDRANTEWSKWLYALPQHNEFGIRNFYYSSLNSRGNYMETTIGICYAAATDGKHMPQGWYIEWASESQKQAWATAWVQWQHCGFTPKVGLDPSPPKGDPPQPLAEEAPQPGATSVKPSAGAQQSGQSSESDTDEVPVLPERPKRKRKKNKIARADEPELMQIDEDRGPPIPPTRGKSRSLERPPSSPRELRPEIEELVDFGVIGFEVQLPGATSVEPSAGAPSAAIRVSLSPSPAADDDEEAKEDCERDDTNTAHEGGVSPRYPFETPATEKEGIFVEDGNRVKLESSQDIVHIDDVPVSSLIDSRYEEIALLEAANEGKIYGTKPPDEAADGHGDSTYQDVAVKTEPSTRGVSSSDGVIDLEDEPEPESLAQRVALEQSDDEFDEPQATPLLDGEAVVRLLTNGAPPAKDFKWNGDNVRRELDAVFPGEDFARFDNYVLVQAKRDAAVHYATGFSDDETIMDQDSGGKVRFHRRPHYFYRLDLNLDGDKKYRRRMKPHLGSGQHFQWLPTVDTDDEGFVKQETFVLKADLVVDAETGEITAEGVGPKGAKESVEQEEWFRCYNASAEKKALKDAYRVVPLGKEIQDHTVDAALESTIASQFVRDFHDRGASKAMENTQSMLRRGMPPSFIGIKRDPVHCACCGEPLIRPLEGEVRYPTDEEVAERRKSKPVLCPFTNGLLHEECVSKHFKDQVGGFLCRGQRRSDEMRRREAERKAQLEATEAAQPGATSVEPSAGARPLPRPVNDARDPIDSYHASLPAVDKVKMKNDRMNRLSRSHMRSQTSDEEDLELVPFCCACGSPDCTRKPNLCRESRKYELERLAVRHVLATPDVEGLSDIVEPVLEELEQRSRRRKERHSQKEEAYKRRVKTAIDADVVLRQASVDGYSTIDQIVRSHSTNVGHVGLQHKQLLLEMADRGQEYRTGTCADALLKRAALSDLERGVRAWSVMDRTHAPQTFAGSKDKILSYWSTVAYETFESNTWAWDATVTVVLSYDKKLEDVQELVENLKSKGMAPEPCEVDDEPTTDLQSDATSVKPSVDASLSDSKAAVREAAEKIAKAWKDGDYTIIMKKQTTGEVKMTIWEIHKNYKRRYRIGRQRRLASYLTRQPTAGLHGDAAATGMDSEEEESHISNMRDGTIGGVQTVKRKATDEDDKKSKSKRSKEEMRQLYPPGSWRCRRCNSYNFPKVERCKGYLKDGGGGTITCGGTPNTTWGGFVEGACGVVNEFMVPAPTGERWHGGWARSLARFRHKAKLVMNNLTEEEKAGNFDDEARRASQRALEKAVHAKKAQRVRQGDKIAAATLADPLKWECSNCWTELKEDGVVVGHMDTFNASTRTNCWMCSYPRPCPGEAGAYRWYCDRPGCPSGGREHCTMSGFYSKCFYCHELYDENPRTRQVAMGEADTAGAPVGKRRRKRGKRGRQAPQSGATSVRPSADASGYADEAEDSESSDEEVLYTRPKFRRTAYAGRTAVPKLAAVALLTMPLMVESVNVVQTTAVPFGLLAVACMFVQRSYQSFDNVLSAADDYSVRVISALEEASVDIVDAIGYQSSRAIPVLFGMLIAFVLCGVSLVLRYWWQRSRALELQQAESMSRTRVPGLPRRTFVAQGPTLTVEGFPCFAWATEDRIAMHVKNFEDAFGIASEPGNVKMLQETDKPYYYFEVSSQYEPRKQYKVSVSKDIEFLKEDDCRPSMRSLIHCGCYGYREVGKTDSLCKHCGAVLFRCRLVRPPALPALDNGHVDKQSTAPLALTDIPKKVSRAKTSARSPSRSPASSKRSSSGYSTPVSSTPKVVVSSPQPGSTSVKPSTGAKKRDSVPVIVETEDEDTRFFNEIVDRDLSKPVIPVKTGCLPKVMSVFDCRKCKQFPCVCRTQIPREAEVCSRCSAVPCRCLTTDDEESPFFKNYDEKAEEAASLFRGRYKGGKLVSLVGAKESHKMANYMIGRAKDYVTLTGFSYDLVSITESLKAASHRFLMVKVYVDRSHALRGTTLKMLERLEELRQHGVYVFLVRGTGSGGIQHSKTVSSDGLLLLGSANWTESSRTNHELGVVLELEGEGRNALRQKMQVMHAYSDPLTPELYFQARQARDEKEKEKKQRSQSVDVGQTARRFSIARRRAQEKVLLTENPEEA